MSRPPHREDHPPQDHPEVLLPFYVNGTLEGEELQHVETHLRSCLVCRREVQELRELRSQVAQVGAASAAERTEEAGEEGLERLLAALDEVDEVDEVESAAPFRRRIPRRWIQALAAVFLVALAVALWRPWGPPTPVEYRTGEEGPQLRSLLSPGEALPRDAFLLRWEIEPALPELRYAVRVTTEDLDLVAEIRNLQSAQWEVAEADLASLAPGTRLHWQVIAMGSDGRPVASRTFSNTLQ